MGDEEPREEEKKLEEKDEEATKEENEGKNEEGKLKAKENKGGEEENKQLWSGVMKIAKDVEEGVRAEEMVKDVMTEAKRGQAKAEIDLTQMIVSVSERVRK